MLFRSDATTIQTIAIALSVLALMIPAGRHFSVIDHWPAWLQNIIYSRYLLATLVLITLPPAFAPYTATRRPS